MLFRPDFDEKFLVRENFSPVSAKVLTLACRKEFRTRYTVEIVLVDLK